MTAGPARAGADVTHLFRPLPWVSPLHRAWAGTKLLALGCLALGLSLVPTWTGVAVVAVVLAVGLAAARVRRGVIPRIPRVVLAALAVGGVLAFLSGGSPFVRIGGHRIGVGGLADWARFLCIGLELLLGSALLAWTTPPAELAPALARLAGPLRRVRVPVDELAATVALGVRCLPLLLDETRTMLAARRLRAQPRERDRRAWLREPHDLLAAVLVVSVRRARELGEAIESRGGLGVVSGDERRPGRSDVPVAVVVLAAIAALAAAALLG